MLTMRSLLHAVLASSLFGVLFGAGIAHSFLSTNAWKLETETVSRATLIEQAHALATNPKAKASVDKLTYNFGVMDVKATGSHDFFITNVGTEDLILILDRTTCSCTGIDISPTRVAPGKAAKCHLKYNAEQAITGKFSQGGIIRTNDPDQREIHLIVEGFFTNPVIVSPTTVNMPRVATGTSRTAKVRFYGFENESLQLSAPAWTDHEHFDFQWETAELSESDRADSSYLGAAKSIIEGTLTLKPGLPVGSFQEWFQLKTNYSSQVSVNFLVSGQIVSGNVAISGQGYNRSMGVAELGRTVMGKSITKEISIQFSGASAQSASVHVKVVEPVWLRTTLASPRDVGPIRIFSLTIEVPEDAPTGSYVFGDGRQAHITLETNDESMPVLRIPLQFAVGRQ
jgi:hypothetical protein